jgi:hypothetical protein
MKCCITLCDIIFQKTVIFSHGCRNLKSHLLKRVSLLVIQQNKILTLKKLCLLFCFWCRNKNRYGDVGTFSFTDASSACIQLYLMGSRFDYVQRVHCLPYSRKLSPCCGMQNLSPLVKLNVNLDVRVSCEKSIGRQYKLFRGTGRVEKKVYWVARRLMKVLGRLSYGAQTSWSSKQVQSYGCSKQMSTEFFRRDYV